MGVESPDLVGGWAGGLEVEIVVGGGVALGGWFVSDSLAWL